jgi:hypothetical protein
MRRALGVLLAAAVVLGATAAGYAALRGADRAALPSARIEPSPVRVTGDTGDLFPGVAATLPIRVRNLTTGPVQLRWVRTIVDAPAGDCDPGYLHAEQIWPRQRIPARGRLDLEVPITLAPEAPDDCQGVTFPLRYRTRVNVLGVRG